MQWHASAVWRALALITPLSMLACAEATQIEPTIITMSVVSGNTQTGMVGTQLPLPLVVRVVDQNGAPIEGQEIRWEATSGAGSVSPETDSTDADGYARTYFRLGGPSGRQTAAANMDDYSPVTFTATAVVAPPAALVIAGGNAQSAPAGSQLPTDLQVRVTDQYDNPLAGVTVDFTVLSGGGSLTDLSAVSANDGIARVKWTLGTTTGTQAVVASSGSLQPVTFTGSAVAGAPKEIVIVSGGDQIGNPGATLPDSLVVRVVDQYGNGVSNLTVNWTPGLTDGTVSSTSNVTGSTGRAAVLWTLGNRGGPMKVAASIAGGLSVAVPGAVYISFETLDAGGRSTCATDGSGSVYCWGYNGYGQLGIGAGSTINPIYTIPQAVTPTGSPAVERVDAGLFHSCATGVSYAGFCWGDNAKGQVGIGSTVDSILVPTAISGGEAFAFISAGRTHSCGVTTGRHAFCWGNNERGQLGGYIRVDTTDLSITYVSSNVPVETGKQTNGEYFATYSYTAISAGGSHSCAIDPDKKAWCWGMGIDGQLGNGANPEGTHLHQAVSGALTFESISAGFLHTCAVATGGTVYCWGSNDRGQLGNTSNSNSNTPVAVSGSVTFASVTSGHGHSCGLSTTGVAYCWGANDQGQLGNGNTSGTTSPVAVGGGLTFRSISAGDYHTCGVTTAGVAYCWGDNGSGALGDGTQTDRPLPSKVRLQH